MQSLKQLCKPRPSVFDNSRRDIVLDLTNLIDDSINPHDFFEENFLTEGMKTLLHMAFRRFNGDSDQSVFVLSQAMGGGKTHNMISLGLLAKHPEIRQSVMGDLYQTPTLGKIRVVAFTGRESDAPLGVWGAIAEQLGKKEVFNNYYSPLQAPGQTAWINLLQGQPLLILLDELPPYFENARSRQIGNSDLAQVTNAALSNLLVAVGKKELSNVCVVISDLRASYESGSEQINLALENLKGEVGRSALTLEPVGMNTDEVYHILRKRLFESLPDDAAITEVARAYAQAVRNANQMDITAAKPEQFAHQLKNSYPFHFAIRDLYARFRENPGFQQTRGLIRLMRVLVSRIFDPVDGIADKLYLIHAHNFDLNHPETLSEINGINSTLANAISHDIASHGQAVAETLDSNLGSSDAQDAAKLILVSSLANVPGSLLGLSLSEVVSFLCAPGRDLSRLPKDVLGNLSTNAWYLHSNTEGKLFFKNVQNLVAKLKTTAQAYNRESSLKELRAFLVEAFTPTLKDCYQEVKALPALDEIDIRPDKITLVISEPHPGGGLSPALLGFYQNQDYKNRVLFLSGDKDILNVLLENAAERKAINVIIDEMQAEKVLLNDPQFVAAHDLRDKINLRLLSALRETFTSIFYPHADQLQKADFIMQFTDNHYNGEKQIRETLKSKQKFTEDTSVDYLKKRCEVRLFTQQYMLWSEVKKRAAQNTAWQWHRPDALDKLKEELVHKDQWRERDTYVDKGPFPPPSTEVRVQQLQRDPDTGRVTLRLTAVNGDTIYYEVGGTATTGSLPVPDPRNFETDELEVSFLCVDSSGKHDTGPPVTWRNTITLKSRVYQQAGHKMVELRAAPAAPIRYTTNGSDPKQSGGLYNGEFTVPAGSHFVLAVAQKNGLSSDVHRLPIEWAKSNELNLDLSRPATWQRRGELTTSKSSYEFLDQLKKHGAALPGPRLSVSSSTAGWVEFTCDDKVFLEADQLTTVIESLRPLLKEGELSLEYQAIKFPTGQRLKDWEAQHRLVLDPTEVIQ